MAWWKVAYLERHRKVSVVRPWEAFKHICKIYQLITNSIYDFESWHIGSEVTTKEWTIAAMHTELKDLFRLKVTVEGRPEDKKQIIKVMSSVKLKRKSSWKRFKPPKGWFFYKARRRGQQRYNANKHKKGGNKDGND